MTTTANLYAKQLASYIRCPEKVRHLTLRDWGRAPSIETIRKMQEPHFRPAQPSGWVKDSGANDGIEFSVSPAKGVSRRKAIVPEKPLEQVKVAPAPVLVPTGKLNAAEVVAHIARHFDVTVADLVGDVRSRKLWDARHCAAYVLVARGNSRAQTGRRLNRNHATIIHSLEKFERHASPDDMAFALAAVAL